MSRFFSVVTLLFVGCASAREPTGDIQIRATATAAVRQGANVFALELHTRGGAPIDQANVRVVAQMTDMPHGPSRAPVVRGLGEGRYRVEDVIFTMPGVWEVRYEVTSPGASDLATFRYDVP